MGDEMQMIGHETARKNFKAASVRGDQDLRTHDVDENFARLRRRVGTLPAEQRPYLLPVGIQE